jgi:hypothetical protein
MTSTGPLTGRTLAVPGDGAAAWHAQRMLRWLGASVESCADNTGSELDWATSGVPALTGRRDGPELLPPGQAASAVRGALTAIGLLADAPVSLPEASVLSQRATLLGLRRDAPRSARGAFEVLRAADGWLGVNLPRPSDRELLEPWLQEPAPILRRAVAGRSVGELASRGRLLGLPVAALPDRPVVDEQLAARGQVANLRPFVLTGWPGIGRPLRDALVVDLSSLWAWWRARVVRTARAAARRSSTVHCTPVNAR